MSDSNETKLRAALARLCRSFPTDTDMIEAGWSESDIEAACKAAEHARSVLSDAPSIGTSGDQAPSEEPVYWESRHFDAAGYPGGWSEWEKVEPRQRGFTVADRLQEFRDYISRGLRYELRPLFAAPQLVERKAQPVCDNGAVGDEAAVERAMETLEDISAWTGEDWTHFLEGRSGAQAAAILRSFYGAKTPCAVPPEGWRCNRAAGHDGPCAAEPSQAHGKSEAVAYPALPEGEASSFGKYDVYDADQMRAYVDADRAQRPAPAAEGAAITVLKGWTPAQPITEEMHVAAVKVLHRANGLDGLPQRMLTAMLAVAPDVAAIGEGVPQPDAARLDAVDMRSWMLEPDHNNDGCWSVYEPPCTLIVTGKLSVRDAIDAALALQAAPAGDKQ